MLKDRHIALKYSLVRLERLQFMKFCAATTYLFDLKPGNNNKYFDLCLVLYLEKHIMVSSVNPGLSKDFFCFKSLKKCPIALHEDSSILCELKNEVLSKTHSWQF